MILQTNKLSKVYSNSIVLNQITMELQEGEIYGLIGPNGAGKTTLMRLISGLSLPTSGSISLFGSADLESQRRKIGTMIEHPAVYTNLTARENLEIACRLFNVTDQKRVDEMLQFVGLANTGLKKARNFSLGMKQRLGIAISLLDRPQFLIWDEPINGLDPKGVCDIRDIILELNHRYHTTFMISSHLLGELGKVATHYGVIKKGELIDQFSKQELEERCKEKLIVEVRETPKAVKILQEHGVLGFTVENSQLIFYNSQYRPEKINQLLFSNQVQVVSIHSDTPDFESYFVAMMGGE